MAEYAISTNHLDFYFDDIKVLDDLNLQVPKGSVFGFLGPNGAGKTTTIRILLDLFPCKMGQIELFGRQYQTDRSEILRKVGALIESPSIYKHLTGRQNLQIIQKMIDVPKGRIDEVLEIVRLSDQGNRKAKTYSLGMCQRLGLATALLTDPELLILDEPTNGLDPSGIIEMRELIQTLSTDHGKTIFLSSHILSEIEKLATDVAIIDRGKILYQGTLSGLNKPQKSLRIVLDQTAKAKDTLTRLGYENIESKADELTLPIMGKEEITMINKALIESGIDVYGLEQMKNSLETTFLNLTKKLDE